jgi:hypothetical protein
MANDDSGRTLERPVLTASERGCRRDFPVPDTWHLYGRFQLGQALGNARGD